MITMYKKISEQPYEIQATAISGGHLNETQGFTSLPSEPALPIKEDLSALANAVQSLTPPTMTTGHYDCEPGQEANVE